MTEWRPFSNGSEYLWWQDQNCMSCQKYVDWTNPQGREVCPLEEALSMGSVTGTIPRSIAHRIGVVIKPYNHLGPCKEKVEAQK